ncbi:MAG TPA: hypothetical protein PLA90_09310 [Candidatus Sumerlaeota bacterium]|nr:hypothetical protein [Candidatus Sumerlaeota bacterium]HPS01729.1 hypothetical protein [Candidatus Sumerlaeota bacterium]
MMMKKEKKIKQRDLAVPAMALRTGKGAHVEQKKKASREICREKVDKERETEGQAVD